MLSLVQRACPGPRNLLSGPGFRPLLARGVSSQEKAARAKLRQDNLKRLLALMKPEKKKIAGGVLLLFASSGVTLSVPFAVGRIIDVIYSKDESLLPNLNVIPPEESEENQDQSVHMAPTDQIDHSVVQDKLNRVCLSLTGLFLLGGLCNYGRVYFLRVAGQRITVRLREALYGSLMKQKVPFYDVNKTGELVNRLSADVQIIGQTLTQNVSDGLRSTIMTASGIGMMLYISPELALVGISVVPPIAACSVYMGRKVKVASKNVQDTLASATQLAEERLSNFRTVAAFAKQEKEIASFHSKMNEVLAVANREARINAKFFGINGLSGNLVILSVLYYGGTLVSSEALSVGNLSSFLLYAAYVGIGLSGLSSFYAELMKGLGASTRTWELIDLQRQETERLKKALPCKKLDTTGAIRFQDVTFAYESRPEIKVLNNLNLEIPSQKVTALVGESGCGKSTVAALILKLYNSSSGLVSIGGTDLTMADEQCLRSNIGYVPQEPVLFSTTIRDNILYGLNVDNPMDLPNAEDILIAAATEANAHDFITAFPQGYDTPIGEKGVLLSGGQKQRIAIARAIVKKPHILVLDEATSALDATSESQVQEALSRVMKDRTVVIIAHRLSTIKNADAIAVLKQGRVMEQGTYEELINQEHGLFREFVRKQEAK